MKEEIMAGSFSLAVYPWSYIAHYNEDNKWEGRYLEKPHLAPEEEAALPERERSVCLEKRNSFPELPLINGTTQYGLGCFEGLKAFPQKDGTLKIFRPEENASRFARSMEGLRMPLFPKELFVSACLGVVARNKGIGFFPRYQDSWEEENFLYAKSIYLRPFTYTEPALGPDLSRHPWVVVAASEVGAYFNPSSTKAITSEKIRAYPGGTGWIKCNANYVISILEKSRAEAEGYIEVIFLDAVEQTYIEEGSSSNIFFYLKNGTLVTPALTDTILAGITRKSIIALAQDMGIQTVERRISLEEVLSEAQEVFVSGTAAGLTYLESITHKGKTVQFNQGKMGPVSRDILKTLKGIQYGALPDRHSWMVEVPRA